MTSSTTSSPYTACAYVRHVVDAAARVHEYHPRLGSRAHRGHRRDRAEGPRRRSRSARRRRAPLRRRRLHRVDRERHVGMDSRRARRAREARARSSSSLAHRRRALRPRRLAADVERCRRPRRPRRRVRSRRDGREELPAVAEAVGRNVEDPHDQGSVRLQRASREPPLRLRSRARAPNGGGHAGATSGPPSSPGRVGLRLHDDARLHWLRHRRRRARLPRRQHVRPAPASPMSSRVSVSRSSSAAAIACSRSRFVVSVCFARVERVGRCTRFDLRVDQLRRLLRHFAAVLDLAAEEELLLVVADEDRTDRDRTDPTASRSAAQSPVAFWMSLDAPVVTRSCPKMSSSATRPPYAIASFASSCWRVIDTRSSSGSVNAMTERAATRDDRDLVQRIVALDAASRRWRGQPRDTP